LTEALSLLDRVSGDRIRHELNIILAENRSTASLAKMSELGILAAIHKELVWDGWLEERFQDILSVPSDPFWTDLIGKIGLEERIKIAYILWTLRLSPGIARNITERIKLSTELRRMVLSTVYLWQNMPGIQNEKPSVVTSRFNDVHPLGIYALFCATEDQAQRDVITRYIQIWRNISPTISGHDLKNQGIPPGPIYRRILEALREAWLDGDITSVEQETVLLDQLIASSRGKLVGNRKEKS
jgi:tRNA nucleotidyltransferase (CCA-adding enzyme)